MVSVENLELTYSGSVRAIDSVSFEAPEGVILTLLGPSGCGKTTTLRSIAGLEKPDSGEIRIGNEVVFSSKQRVFVPPNKRKIGMVFQSYAIWPHMTVFDNVAYPLRAKKMSKAEREKNVTEVLEVVGLAKLAHRPAPHLSGGQQQRVALARALVARPEVLLLDEPLSNLDAKLREEMRHELKQLQRRLKITSIYVTHDQEEALALSDILVIMNEGKIVQVGAPRELYQKPRLRFAGDFLGLANHLPGKLSAEPAGTAGLRKVETAIGTINAEAFDDLDPGEEVIVSVRPENILISKEPPASELNSFRGRITRTTFLGHSEDCWATIKDHSVRLRIHPDLGLEPGHDVYFSIRPDRCVIIPLTPGVVRLSSGDEPGNTVP